LRTRRRDGHRPRGLPARHLADAQLGRLLDGACARRREVPWRWSRTTARASASTARRRTASCCTRPAAARAAGLAWLRGGPASRAGECATCPVLDVDPRGRALSACPAAGPRRRRRRAPGSAPRRSRRALVLYGFSPLVGAARQGSWWGARQPACRAGRATTCRRPGRAAGTPGTATAGGTARSRTPPRLRC
jgi:hypothetical protein